MSHPAQGPGRLERFEGALLGLACGDALGGPAEFYPRERMPAVTGMHGGGKFRLAPGEWTDDTAMAICLAESLLACNGVDPVDQMRRYWRWANEGYRSTRPTAFGMGKTVAQALMAFHRTGTALAGSARPDTAGNGSLMRAAPVPLFFHGDRGRALQAAETCSRTTHGAEECLASCRYLTALLYACLDGAADKDAVLRAADDVPLPPGMQRLRDQAFRTLPREAVRSTSYVVDSLEAALWCFWHADSYAQAVLLAANLGGDADTTAAICGQLAGAFHGVGAIPAEWLDVLHHRDLLAGLALQLSERTQPND